MRDFRSCVGGAKCEDLCNVLMKGVEMHAVERGARVGVEQSIDV